MTGEPAFRGVWATILLSLRDGEIDDAAIGRQVQAYADAGVDGVYCGGTAAEIHALSDARFRSVSASTAAAARTVGLPFQIGAAHPLAPGSLERVACAASLRPAGIQVTLPDWTPIDLGTARRFLQACADAADGIPLILYNPPHARTTLSPGDVVALADAVPQLAGLKCGGGDRAWHDAMAPAFERLSVFVPGHHYASSVAQGAHGSYSNMACLDPAAAVAWARQVPAELDAALALEARIASFMAEAIAPLVAAGLPGYACDKAMAAAGGWTEIAPDLLWPHRGASSDDVRRIAIAARRHIPEFMPQ